MPALSVFVGLRVPNRKGTESMGKHRVLSPSSGSADPLLLSSHWLADNLAALPLSNWTSYVSVILVTALVYSRCVRIVTLNATRWAWMVESKPTIGRARSEFAELATQVLNASRACIGGRRTAQV